jgi:pSer/pThr/pTyr-binding forkhead associated (FHA) protein
MSTPSRPPNFYRFRGLLLPVVSDLHGGLNTVGRNPTNDVVIHEASVSSFHAEVTVGEDGVVVRDLQSTNGTFVDDEPITEKEIRSGQVVQFGTVAFRLEIEEEIRINVPKPAPAVPAAAGLAAGPSAAMLPDGTVACSKTPSVPATHRCTKCGRAFHFDNLRILRLSGGAATMLFCPECSAHVEPIPGIDPAKARRPGILSRLTQTIQLGFRRAK